MVSWLMESTISSSTTLRASNRNVQFAYPFVLNQAQVNLPQNQDVTEH
jgi:hypothetical protein